MAGFAAALWLLGLFLAAPALRTSARYDFTDRLRDALILGVTIPFALGFVHAFYAIACWAALAIALAVAAWRGFAEESAVRSSASARVPYVLVGALAAVAWPQVIRPLLDGDSLSYHLPNAASWAQAHSLWTTATRYWWYPPASELFASALYVVSGPFALPWSGFGALALLGLRLYAWARDSSASPLLADTLAAATITAAPLAFQAGTLQNDVWLAAFWLESLWLMRAGVRSAAAPTLAITALMKPQGWILAAIAMLARNARSRLWFAAALPLGLWLVRNALLWNRAIAAPTMYGSLYGSTILAHGLPALFLLVRVAFAMSPFALLAILAALAGPLIARRDTRFGWAACSAAILFFVLPFSYATTVAQLATGASLRFAVSAIAAGAVILARPAQRITSIAVALLLASTVLGVAYVLATFWNDAPTRTALAVIPIALGLVWWARPVRRRWAIALGFVLAGLGAGWAATRHTVDFYTDAFRVNGRATGFYAWVATTQPAAIGGWGLALGTVNVLAPRTRTLELPEFDACATTRRQHVLLVAIAQNDRTAAFNAVRLQASRNCGAVRYDDGITVVAAPLLGVGR